MKILWTTIIGIPITILVCFLFSGGVVPVENYIYLSLFKFNGWDILIWLSVCFGVGLIILDTVGFESETN